MSLIFSSVLCPKTFSVFVTNEIKYLNILFLVYLIFHLYIFQCAYLLTCISYIFNNLTLFFIYIFFNVLARKLKIISRFLDGGAEESRTPDLLLARQAL